VDYEGEGEGEGEGEAVIGGETGIDIGGYLRNSDQG